MTTNQRKWAEPQVGRAWIGESGEFLFGKYQDDLAEDVARRDPAYVCWVVNEVENVSDEDRNILSLLLARRKGGG